MVQVAELNRVHVEEAMENLSILIRDKVLAREVEVSVMLPLTDEEIGELEEHQQIKAASVTQHEFSSVINMGNYPRQGGHKARAEYISSGHKIAEILTNLRGVESALVRVGDDKSDGHSLWVRETTVLQRQES